MQSIVITGSQQQTSQMQLSSACQKQNAASTCRQTKQQQQTQFSAAPFG